MITKQGITVSKMFKLLYRKKLEMKIKPGITALKNVYSVEA